MSTKIGKVNPWRSVVYLQVLGSCLHSTNGGKPESISDHSRPVHLRHRNRSGTRVSWQMPGARV